jgi:hypothetical protein
MYLRAAFLRQTTGAPARRVAGFLRNIYGLDWAPESASAKV